MEQVSSTKTIFTVGQYLNWQRSSVLQLSPNFQRRSVWKPAAKSYLIDSVVRGFSLPVILLRQVQNLQDFSLVMEVVDGQQRLRTLLSYIDPGCLANFDNERDRFTVSKVHNADLAGKRFSQLDERTKHSILSYEISTHVFPASTGDAEIYRIFARLNSTGLTLKPQEIRNSEFHGEFKTFVYDLAFEFFDLWRNWGVYSSEKLARMDEVEATSEFVMTMLSGIQGKSQSRINDFYRDHDAEGSFTGGASVRRRFEAVMGALSSKINDIILQTAFTRPALFFSLFVAVYDHMFGLGSPVRPRKGVHLPSHFATDLCRSSDAIKAETLPAAVQDAMGKATSDKARRQVRHKYLMRALRLESAN